MGGKVNCVLHVIHGKSGALRTDASCNCRRAWSSLINRIRLQFCAAHFTLSLIMPLSQSVAKRDKGAQHDEQSRQICWTALWRGCKCTPAEQAEKSRGRAKSRVFYMELSLLKQRGWREGCCRGVHALVYSLFDCATFI